MPAWGRRVRPLVWVRRAWEVGQWFTTCTLPWWLLTAVASLSAVVSSNPIIRGWNLACAAWFVTLACAIPVATRWAPDLTSAVDIEHRRDDTPWDEAPRPPRWHRCRPWTKGQHITDAVIYRCACGARRTDEHPWTDRNTRPVEETRRG